jgi:chemotaxis signal transduction protein
MRFAPPLASKSRPVRAEQMILFRIGSQLFAISASAVQEVRSGDSLAGAATELRQSHVRKVRHVVRRGKRTVYVVNGAMHFGLPPSQAALVLLLRRGRAALLVDAIEKMTAIRRLQAVPRAFCHVERTWYRGLIVAEDTVIPVLNPGGLLEADELSLLDNLVADIASEFAAASDEARVTA